MTKWLIVVSAAAIFAAGAGAQSAPAGPAATGQAGTGQAGTAETAPDASALKTTQEKNGYALGMQIGIGIRKQGLDVDGASFAKGFSDAFTGGKTLLSEDEMRAALKAAQQDFEKKLQDQRTAKAEAAKKDADAFLAANKAKEGVVTLPDGLQYKILKAGDGKKPDVDDTVVCNYRGTLLDGTEFDNSDKHDGPATFNLKGVIKGWTEALQLMPVGSKWQLYVPAELAYGENGAGNVIPPNAALIFDVELLSIKDDKPGAKDRDRE